MEKAVREPIQDWTKRTGNAVKRTAGSFVAGVGNVSSQPESYRPEVADHTTDEAFERYKEYNTKTNLRANERRMWGGLVSQIAGNVMFAAAAALGVSALATAHWALAAAVFVGAIGVSAASFFYFQQSATREQTEKGMDVSDYHLKRSAGLIAQEIKKELADGNQVGESKETYVSQGNSRSDGKQWTQALAEQDPQTMHRA